MKKYQKIFLFIFISLLIILLLLIKFSKIFRPKNNIKINSDIVYALNELNKFNFYAPVNEDNTVDYQIDWAIDNNQYLDKTFSINAYISSKYSGLKLEDRKIILPSNILDNDYNIIRKDSKEQVLINAKELLHLENISTNECFKFPATFELDSKLYIQRIFPYYEDGYVINSGDAVLLNYKDDDSISIGKLFQGERYNKSVNKMELPLISFEDLYTNYKNTNQLLFWNYCGETINIHKSSKVQFNKINKYLFAVDINKNKVVLIPIFLLEGRLNDIPIYAFINLIDIEKLTQEYYIEQDESDIVLYYDLITIENLDNYYNIKVQLPNFYIKDGNKYNKKDIKDVNIIAYRENSSEYRDSNGITVLNKVYDKINKTIRFKIDYDDFWEIEKKNIFTSKNYTMNGIIYKTEINNQNYNLLKLKICIEFASSKTYCTNNDLDYHLEYPQIYLNRN